MNNTDDDKTDPAATILRAKPPWLALIVVTSFVSLVMGGVGSAIGFAWALQRELGAFTTTQTDHARRLEVIEKRPPSGIDLGPYVKRTDFDRELDRVRGDMGGLERRIDRMEDRLESQIQTLSVNLDDKTTAIIRAISRARQ